MRVYKSGTEAPAGPFRVSGNYQGEAFTGKTHDLCTWPDWVMIAFDPDTGTARSMGGGVVIEVESWMEFEKDVLPYVRARELHKLVKAKLGMEVPVQTLGLDTYSVAAQRLVREINPDPNKQTTMQQWGRLLSTLTDVTMQMIDTTRQYQEDQRTYNVIINAHLTFVGGGEDGNKVVGWRPAIPGQFRDILPRLGGFTFICKQEVTQTLSRQSGKPEAVRTFKVHTAPPSDLYLAGDRIGGAGKLYKPLPPVMGGTYPELMVAWGLDPEAEAKSGREHNEKGT